MVKIRLMRLGRKKRPFYRLIVANARSRRDGAPIAELGYYDPIRKQLKINRQLALEWIGKGAVPSETAQRLIALAPDSGELIELPKKALKHLNAAPVKPEEPEAKPDAKPQAQPTAVTTEVEAPKAEAPAPAEAPKAEATSTDADAAKTA